MTGGRAFDVDGPVQAEVFVLYLADSQVMLTGPCGAGPWYLEVGAGQDPLAVVTAAFTRVIGPPLVVHSTSWRTDRESVVLSFVVITAAPVSGQPAIAVGRSELARGDAAAAPAVISSGQVIEHGLRHLAWLVQDDPAIASALPAWVTVLGWYLPEPFRQLPA